MSRSVALPLCFLCFLFQLWFGFLWRFLSVMRKQLPLICVETLDNWMLVHHFLCSFECMNQCCKWEWTVYFSWVMKRCFDMFVNWKVSMLILFGFGIWNADFWRLEVFGKLRIRLLIARNRVGRKRTSMGQLLELASAFPNTDYTGTIHFLHEGMPHFHCTIIRRIFTEVIVPGVLVSFPQGVQWDTVPNLFGKGSLKGFPIVVVDSRI